MASTLEVGTELKADEFSHVSYCIAEIKARKLRHYQFTIHKMLLVMLKIFKTFIFLILLFFLPVTGDVVVLGLTGLAVTGGTFGFRIDRSCFRSVTLSGNEHNIVGFMY